MPDIAKPGSKKWISQQKKPTNLFESTAFFLFCTATLEAFKVFPGIRVNNCLHSSPLNGVLRNISSFINNLYGFPALHFLNQTLPNHPEHSDTPFDSTWRSHLRSITQPCGDTDCRLNHDKQFLILAAFSFYVFIAKKPFLTILYIFIKQTIPQIDNS
jgi:hypothetical protein